MRNWNASTLEDIWYNVKLPNDLYLNKDLDTTIRADEAEGFTEWSAADQVAERYERLTGIRPNIIPVDLSIWI